MVLCMESRAENKYHQDDKWRNHSDNKVGSHSVNLTVLLDTFNAYNIFCCSAFCCV